MTAPTLLVAFDGSASATAAVRVAGTLFPGPPAIIVHVRRDAATLGQAAALARIAIPDAATVLGSVSSGLVHNADVPVLVVPDAAGIPGRAPAFDADDRQAPAT